MIYRFEAEKQMAPRVTAQPFPHSDQCQVAGCPTIIQVVPIESREGFAASHCEFVVSSIVFLACRVWTAHGYVALTPKANCEKIHAEWNFPLQDWSWEGVFLGPLLVIPVQNQALWSQTGTSWFEAKLCHSPNSCLGHGQVEARNPDRNSLTK